MGRVDDQLEVASGQHAGGVPWKVLIVDDEPEVHAVTRLVLGGFRFEGDRLDFLSAHSAAEARGLLRRHPDIAVLLLDVVMESEQAGLELVRDVREVLGNPFVRIVLRTGQAGQAPEHEVIAAYDINDYKEKTELTAARLATTMYAALRAYRDMRTIEAHRLGLEGVLRASAQVFVGHGPQAFGASMLASLGDLLMPDRGMLECVAKQDAGPAAPIRIVSSSGCHAETIDTDVGEVVRDPLLRGMRTALREQRNVFGADYCVLHFLDARKAEQLLFVGDGCRLSALDRKLVELFCSNAAIAFENLQLSGDLLSSQLEMVYLLAGAAETRSQETANHVHRVGLLAEMLGNALGLERGYSEMLRSAAPLHDIGKIGIPDTILGKPGTHTEEEMAVMRTHAEIGARLLGSSQRPVLKLAAEIAATHHENWDGSGYPRGLAGEAIPVSGRITMVADVVDALGSRRCYKEPWPESEIRAFIQSQRGHKFDPAIVDRLMEHWDDAMKLREELPD